MTFYVSVKGEVVFQMNEGGMAKNPITLIGGWVLSFAAKHRPERLQKLHRLALSTNLAR